MSNQESSKVLSNEELNEIELCNGSKKERIALDATVSPVKATEFKVDSEKNYFYFVKPSVMTISDIGFCAQSEKTFDITLVDLALNTDLLDSMNFAYLQKGSNADKIQFFIYYLLSFQNISDIEMNERADKLKTNPMLRVLISSDSLRSEIIK